MFKFNHQPVAPLDVELYLESSRSRIAAEMEGIETTVGDRQLVEASFAQLDESVSDLMEHPSTRTLADAQLKAFTLHSVFLHVSLLEILPRWTERTQEFAATGVWSTDKALVANCVGIGSTLLHGLKVARWAEKKPRDEITDNNTISYLFARLTEDNLGTRRDARKLGRILQITH
ncbi:MAG TPA: hypothetical protein VLF91_02875 [Candidatus Saccharimonadales bacterium]|nr:hypothetical protein [Candidatus Saccharimonadales bacterium]